MMLYTLQDIGNEWKTPKRRKGQTDAEYATTVIRKLRPLCGRDRVYAAWNPADTLELWVGTEYVARREPDTFAPSPLRTAIETLLVAERGEAAFIEQGAIDNYAAAIEIPSRGTAILAPAGPTWKTYEQVANNQQGSKWAEEDVATIADTDDPDYLALTCDNGGVVHVQRNYLAFACAANHHAIWRMTAQGGAPIRAYNQQGDVIAIAMPYRHNECQTDWEPFSARDLANA